MEPQTVIEVVAPKTTLARKALILSGATVGLILAGGFAYLKTRSSSDDAVASDAADN